MKARMFFTLYAFLIATTISTSLFLSQLTAESLTFVDCEFDSKYDHIILSIRNTGIISVTIVEVLLNAHPYRYNPAGLFVIPARETPYHLHIVHNWSSGFCYIITLITERGNIFLTAEGAPQKEPPLKIKDVNWNSTDNTIRIVVQNIGTTERIITCIGLGNSSNQMHLHYLSSVPSIPVDQTSTLIFEWPYDYGPSWTKGKTYWFSISTVVGPDNRFTREAP